MAEAHQEGGEADGGREGGKRKIMKRKERVIEGAGKKENKKWERKKESEGE